MINYRKKSSNVLSDRLAKATKNARKRHILGTNQRKIHKNLISMEKRLKKKLYDGLISFEELCICIRICYSEHDQRLTMFMRVP